MRLPAEDKPQGSSLTTQYLTPGVAPAAHLLAAVLRNMTSNL